VGTSRVRATSAVGKSSSLIDRLAAFFRAHPRVWFDGRELAAIGGQYAWRTRISNLRRAPFHLTIRNRQRKVNADGRSYVISEYCYLPDDPAREGTTAAPPWALTPDGR